MGTAGTQEGKEAAKGELAYLRDIKARVISGDLKKPRRRKLNP